LSFEEIESMSKFGDNPGSMPRESEH
jgi:hypothetical protein